MRRKWLVPILSVFLAGCVPSGMHVTYGLRPNVVDDDVRFRTTYYFRTFDYCWDANPSVAQLQKLDGKSLTYQKIIPQTDTLYRYRMTGKASALFNRIRFESGTLRREEIDPFGTQVSYSSDADGFVVRDRGEIKAEAENKAAKQRLRERIDFMIERLSKLPEATEEDKALKKNLADAVTKAVNSYLEVPSLTSQEAKDLDQKFKAIAVSDAKLRATVENLAAEVKAKTASADVLGPCPIGQTFRKGFQIMGPEGVKTFDQNERLVMAMSNSAKPLIETLQEYSGRILNQRADLSPQLVALAQENARMEETRRKIADARRLKTSASGVFSIALQNAGDGQ